MRYNKNDIHFEQISPRAFENLCYDLILKYGFYNLIWREGGADNGRDIEACYIFNNPIKSKETKWFFECKHYTQNGVPPEHLNSKIAWADAELPNSLVIFTSAYLTNNARVWLEKLAPQKSYDIICIEGEEIRDRLMNYPELIDRYFSQGRYEKMLKDVKDYKIKFNINPSFEVLKEIIEHIDMDKLDIDDFGFILTSFYDGYKLFELRNEIYGDFDSMIIHRLLEYLRYNVKNEVLSSFEEYGGNYDDLDGNGIFDEMNWLDEEDFLHDMRKFDFQIYHLHLNHKQESEKWKIGLYLFIVYNDVAFELFKADTTQIRVLENFTPDKIGELSIKLKLHNGIVEDYKRYLNHFK